MRLVKSIPGRTGLLSRGKGATAEVFSFTGKLKAGSLVNNLRTVTWKSCRKNPTVQVECYLIRVKGLMRAMQPAATFKLVSRFIFLRGVVYRSDSSRDDRCKWSGASGDRWL